MAVPWSHWSPALPHPTSAIESAEDEVKRHQQTAAKLREVVKVRIRLRTGKGKDWLMTKPPRVMWSVRRTRRIVIGTRRAGDDQSIRFKSVSFRPLVLFCLPKLTVRPEIYSTSSSPSLSPVYLKGIHSTLNPSTFSFTSSTPISSLTQPSIHLQVNSTHLSSPSRQLRYKTIHREWRDTSKAKRTSF